MDDKDTAFLHNLSDVQIFISTDTILGVPTILFVPTTALCIVLSFMSAVIFGLMLAALALPSLVLMHRKDPKALTILIANIGQRGHSWVPVDRQIQTITIIEN